MTTEDKKLRSLHQQGRPDKGDRRLLTISNVVKPDPNGNRAQRRAWDKKMKKERGK